MGSDEDEYYYDSYSPVSDEPLEPVRIIPLNSSFLVQCEGTGGDEPDQLLVRHNGALVEWAEQASHPAEWAGQAEGAEQAGPPHSYLVERADWEHSGAWSCSSSQAQPHYLSKKIFFTNNCYLLKTTKCSIYTNKLPLVHKRIKKKKIHDIFVCKSEKKLLI
jgi:hypothetical protein